MIKQLTGFLDMNAIQQSCLLLVALILLSSNPLHAQSLDQLNQNGFPLAVGNLWEYHITASFKIEDEPIGGFETEAIWKIVAREEVLGQEAFRFEITHRYLSGSDSTVAIAETWFAMRGDSLLSVASRGDLGRVPHSAQLFKVVQEDDANPWNITTLVFPLAVGQSWEFGTGLPDIDSDYKVVEARETQEVLAGEFETFRVVHIQEGSGINSRTEQWFAAIGLVKMRFFSLHTQRRLDERGKDIGEFTFQENTETKLVRFHLAREPTTIEQRSWGQLKKSSRLLDRRVP